MRKYRIYKLSLISINLIRNRKIAPNLRKERQTAGAGETRDAQRQPSG